MEHRTQPLISRRAFAIRLLRHGGYGGLLIGGSVLVGMLGYHEIAGLSWVDSFLNASMLLGGMGPVGDPGSTAAKLFAGFFALYSGLVFLLVAAVLLTPVFHRVLHRFHLEKERGER